MTYIKFNNGVTLNGGGNETLNALITESVKQENLVEESKDLKAKLMYTNKRPLQINEEFGSINGVNELPLMNENETKEEMERIIGPKKGFKIVERGGKLTESFLFTEWLRTAQPLSGAKESIQGKALDLSENSSSLIKSADLASAINMVEVLTKGFSITAANGAGSATPKGKALFATDHTIYKLPGVTFSNKIADNGVLTAARLQIALDLLKSARLENGQKVKQPKGKDAYKLFVSREGAVTAREILNTAGNKAGPYTGSGLNAVNQFYFDGNFVELVEIDQLGDYDRDGNVIGSTNMWFVMNPRYIREAKALKEIDLYDKRVKSYINDETDQTIVDIRKGDTYDHFGAEYGIVGALGTVA